MSSCWNNAAIKVPPCYGRHPAGENAMPPIKTILEPAREIPVLDDVDVLVAGGGPAGMIAAVAAARTGARTFLVEQNGFLGGNLTAGSVLNIRSFTDGRKQVVGGFAADFADRLRTMGGTTQTPGEGGYVRHDPEVTKFVAQEMVLEAGVNMLLHTQVAATLAEGDQLQGIIIENKSGRSAIRARVTVDATGDGDVFARAGAAFHKSDGELQPMTLVFMIAGADRWPDGLDEETRQRVAMEVEADTFPVKKGVTLFALARQGEYYANTTRIAGDCSDAWDLTRGEVEGLRQVESIMDWLRHNAPGFENARLLSTAPSVGTRESRRLAGVYELTREDVLSYRHFEDDILHCHYYIDIHNPGKGNVALRLEPGRNYGIPYRCLIPCKLDGLLVAGRCISATHEAIGSARVMALCMGMGHAAGTAAALAARNGIAPRDLDAALLRDTLRQQGSLL